MSDYCYFARVLSEATVIPIELCDYILSFSSDEVPIKEDKANAPVGWFLGRRMLLRDMW